MPRDESFLGDFQWVTQLQHLIAVRRIHKSKVYNVFKWVYWIKYYNTPINLQDYLISKNKRHWWLAIPKALQMTKSNYHQQVILLLYCYWLSQLYSYYFLKIGCWAQKWTLQYPFISKEKYFLQTITNNFNLWKEMFLIILNLSLTFFNRGEFRLWGSHILPTQYTPFIL